MDWNEYGLGKPSHEEADRVLDAILATSSNPAAISAAAKEAVWRLVELPKLSTEFQVKYR